MTAAALVPTIAHAAAPTVSRPTSELAKPPAAATPELATGLTVLGTVQPLASGTSDCAAWTAAACAATTPALSANGATGSCTSGTYLECCPQAAACAPLLQSVYQQTYAVTVDAGAGSSFMVPATMPSGNTSVNGLGYASAPTAAVAGGTMSTVLGNQAALFTAPGYTGSSAAATTQQLSAAQGAYISTWNGPRYTGGAINSCDEYVWQKWASYSRWEDAARAGVNDPVYEVAQSPAAFLAPNFASPWVRSDGQPISVNGTTFNFAYTIGDTIPRNVFFSFLPSWLSGSTNSTQLAIYNSINNEITHPFVLGTSSSDVGYDQNDTVWVYGCGSTGETGCATMGGPFPWFTPYSVTQCSQLGGGGGGGTKTPEVLQALTGSKLGNCTTTTQWMPMTQAADLADNETFNSEQARLDAYTSLLAELGDLSVTQASLTHQLAALSGTTPTIAYPTINAPLLSGAAAPPSSQPTPTFASYYFPHSLARRVAAALYATQAAQLPLPSFKAPPAGSPSAGTFTALQAQLASTQQAIAAVQQQMTQALENEWSSPSKGCLLGLIDNTQYANSCDWSPKSFIQQYVGLFEAQRQAAYARCLADTGDVFPLSMNQDGSPPTPFANTALDTSAQWTDSLADFENFMDEYEVRDVLNYIYDKQVASTDANFQNETSTLPVLTTNATSTTAATSATIGQSAGDTHQFGGSYFGATASYTAEWQATAKLEPAANVPPKQVLINEVDEQVQGSLVGTVTVFGAKQPIVNASVTLDSQPGLAGENVNFAVLGTSIYTSSASFTPDTAPLAIANLSDTPASAGFSTIIPILCIPVKVSAGVSLTVGVTATGDASPPPQTPTPTNLSGSVTGTVTPFAHVDGYAQVGVDVLIASVGIEGNITLIDANVPITGTVAVGSTAGGPFTLNSSVTANLQLNELAGEIDLYAQVGVCPVCDTAKIYLLSWNGFHQEIPLFNPITASWPIDAINYRVFGNTNPADVN
jgi:hypothetical protein